MSGERIPNSDENMSNSDFKPWSKDNMTNNSSGSSPELSKQGKRFLTIPQLSRASGLAQSSLYDWARQRKFKSARIGRSIKVRSDWWNEFMERLDTYGHA